MSGTTFEGIRTNMESLIRALTPTKRPDVKFRIWDDKRDMVSTLSQNPGRVRSVAIAHTFGATTPTVSDTHAYETDESFVVQVVYPLHMFSESPQELEGIIASDLHQIDDAIGIHGVDNYVAHQHVAALQQANVNATDNMALLAMEYALTFTREVN